MSEKYKGWKNYNYYDNKTEDERRRTVGIVKGVWVYPDDVYTLHNLPLWCYCENWNRERRAEFMKNKNEYLEQKRKAKYLKMKKDQNYRRKRNIIADEKRRVNRVGNICDDPKHIHNVVFEYMGATGLSWPNAKNMSELIFFWTNCAIPRRDALEVLENYFVDMWLPRFKQHS